ncbi:MAG TPA: hypothetical protein VKT73_16690 [Xanthobacteraceae bacterium]|nr:hypothetical protein [Xanthobacteraceae bacterium]
MSPQAKIIMFKVSMLAAAAVCAIFFEPSYLLAQTAVSPRLQDSAIGSTLDAKPAVPVKQRPSSVEISTDKQPASDKAPTSAINSK